MKLTKEEFDKWEASGEIKRMSHSNIVKGIVNIKKAEQTMSRSEYKDFQVLYEMELLIDDVYEITCAGFWNVVTDIVIRLKKAAPIGHFVFNKYVLQRVEKIIKPSEFSWWFALWMLPIYTAEKLYIGIGGALAPIIYGFVMWLTRRSFMRKSNKRLSRKEKLLIYLFYTLLFLAICFALRFLHAFIYTIYFDFH